MVVVVKIRLAVDYHLAAKSHLAAESCSENNRPVAESFALKNLPELGNRPVSKRVAKILVVESLAEESLAVNTLVVIETLTNDFAWDSCDFARRRVPPKRLVHPQNPSSSRRGRHDRHDRHNLQRLQY